MSAELSAAIARAAEVEGVTAGAWVRKTVLDRLGMQSENDGRSNRPVPRPSEDVAAISSAIRELAAMSAALALDDNEAVRSGLARARAILIPLAIRRARR